MGRYTGENGDGLLHCKFLGVISHTFCNVNHGGHDRDVRSEAKEASQHKGNKNSPLSALASQLRDKQS